MEKQEFVKKLYQHEKEFDNLWSKIVEDVNKYVEENGNTNPSHIEKTERFLDSLCLSGAWISDRLNGFSGVPQSNKYNKSLTKKIRKALGYTL